MLTYLRSITRILVKTALAASVPFIPALTGDFAGTWQAALLTIALAVVIAAATALMSIPDASSLGWGVSALAKALRQFGQMVAASTVGAVLLTDVDWGSVLLVSAGSALSTLVIAAVDSLSDDPGLPTSWYEEDDLTAVDPVEDTPPEFSLDALDPEYTPAE